MSSIASPKIGSFSPDSGIVGDDITDASILTLTGTAIANSTVAIFDGTTQLGMATANANGAWSFTTGTLANGVQSFTATDTDAAGNTSAASAALNVRVDTIAPAAPSISSFSPNSGTAGANITNATTVTLIGSAEANSTVAVFDGTTQLGMAPVNGSGAWSFTTGTLANGVQSFTAADTDVAGNTGAASAALSVTVQSDVSTEAIPLSYFGMQVESAGYNFGQVEAWPTIPFSIARSLSVWSPGNGSINGIGWASLNPASGVYNWTALDAWIAECQQNHIQMIYTLTNPPAWAGGSNPNPNDLQAFMTALVTHVGSAIQYYEGLNEWNDGTNFTGSIGQLVTLQQVLYNTVHQLDSAGEVLSPTYTGSGGQPMLAFLNAGGGAYFDIAAMHGYVDASGESIIQQVDNFKAALVEGGAGNKPIWDTEWGWWPNTPPAQNVQAAFVSTELILQWALGVQMESFYAYDDVQHGIYNQTTGTLTQAGIAFHETTQWLLGATMPNGYQVNGTVYTVPLLRGGQSELLVWNYGGSSSYSAGPYTQYEDLTGTIYSIVGNQVPISDEPILLMTPLTSGPAVSSVVASGSGITNGSGYLNAGHVVTLTVNLSEAATVAGGTPTLTLNDGGTATYTGGSGSNALTFSYTVAAGQNTSDLAVTAVNLNSATVADAAGNTANLTGAVTTPAGTLQIDTTGPAVSSVVASGSGITNGAGDLNAGHVVTLTVNLSEAVTVAGGTPALTLNDGGTATYTGGSGSNALTFSYTVAAGQNTSDLAVTAVNLNSATIADAAGNTANLTGAVTTPAGTLQIDTTAPAAPVISSDSPASGNAVTLIGTAEANSTVTVFDGTTKLGTATVNSSGAWSFTTGTLANGAHSFTAAAMDAAGNISLASQPVDPIIGVTVPLIASFSPDTGVVGDGITSATTLTVTGTAAANTTVTVFDGTTKLGTAMVNASGAWSYTTGTLSNATHSFTAMDTDAAGNTSAASATLAVTVDTVAPAAPAITSFSPDTGTVGDGITSATTLTLTGTAAANTTVTVFDGTTKLGTAMVNASGAWSYATGTLSNATHSFTTTDTDASGNTSAASAALAVTVDTVAPTAPVISSDSPASGTAVTLIGTAEANSLVTVFEGTSVLGTVTANSAGAWSFTTGQLSSGAHTFTATATDAAGNVSAMSQPIDPTIASATYSASNTSLTITDSNDTIILSGSSDTVNLTGGSNAIQLSGSNDSLTITGSGNSVIVTGSSNSVSTSGTGGNSITFGTGAVTLSFTGGSNTVKATQTTLLAADKLTGAGSDTVALSGGGTINLNTPTVFSGFATVTEDNSNTALTLKNGATLSVTLGSGTDSVTGGSTASSTSGSTTSSSGRHHHTIVTVAPSPTPNVARSNAIVTLGTGTDTVIFTEGKNTINATQTTLLAADKLTGAGSDTLALTGGGSFTSLGILAHFSGFSTVTLDNSGSTLNIGNNSLTVNGTAGGNNTITLGSGTDIVNLGTGNDTVTLGTGTATVSFTGGSNTVNATQTTLVAADSLTGAGGDTLALTGSGSFNLKSLKTFTGFSEVTLGTTGESLTLKSGQNLTVTTFNEASGNRETVTLASHSGTDTVAFSGSGTNTVNATIGTGATLNLADNLTGSGSDTLALTGNSGTVNLNQLAHFSGFSGVTLSGSSDTLTLTNDNLTVTRLSGSGDTITLGTGIDTVVYTSVNPSIQTKHGHNTITSHNTIVDTLIGFNTSQDQIDVSAITGLNRNVQAVTVNFLTAPPTSIAAHTIDVVTSGANTVVYANATGSNESIGTSQVDMQINLTGVAAPSSSDFILHH